MKRVNSNPRPPKGAKPTPPPNPPPAAGARYTRIDAVLADVRDRVKADDHESQTKAASELAVMSRRIEALGLDSQAAGNEPLHFDSSVACTFREDMLQVCAIAATAVLEHDRRMAKARRGRTP